MPNVMSPPTLWPAHALVCCDSDHGSTSSMAPPPPSVALSNASDVSLPSALSSVPTSTAGSVTAASALGSVPPSCASPCPFEAYCCLDEHCAPDAACGGDACPNAKDGPQTHAGCTGGSCGDCCDDPKCAPSTEWCLPGCTIEEYVSHKNASFGRRRSIVYKHTDHIPVSVGMLRRFMRHKQPHGSTRTPITAAAAAATSHPVIL